MSYPKLKGTRKPIYVCIHSIVEDKPSATKTTVSELNKHIKTCSFSRLFAHEFPNLNDKLNRLARLLEVYNLYGKVNNLISKGGGHTVFNTDVLYFVQVVAISFKSHADARAKATKAIARYRKKLEEYEAGQNAKEQEEVDRIKNKFSKVDLKKKLHFCGKPDYGFSDFGPFFNKTVTMKQVRDAAILQVTDDFDNATQIVECLAHNIFNLERELPNLIKGTSYVDGDEHGWFGLGVKKSTVTKTKKMIQKDMQMEDLCDC